MLVSLAVLLLALTSYCLGLRQNIKELNLKVHQLQTIVLTEPDVSATCVSWWAGSKDLFVVRDRMCNGVRLPKTKK